MTIYDPDEPQVTWQGVLERFDGIGRDEITKTIPCRIVIEQPIVHSQSGPRAWFAACMSNAGWKFKRPAEKTDICWFPFLHWRCTLTTMSGSSRTRNFNGKCRGRRSYRNDFGRDRQENRHRENSNDDLRPGDSIVISPLSQPTVGAPVILREDTVNRKFCRSI